MSTYRITGHEEEMKKFAHEAKGKIIPISKYHLINENSHNII